MRARDRARELLRTSGAPIHRVFEIGDAGLSEIDGRGLPWMMDGGRAGREARRQNQRVRVSIPEQDAPGRGAPLRCACGKGAATISHEAA